MACWQPRRPCYAKRPVKRIALLLLLAACHAQPVALSSPNAPQLQVVARSTRQWNGVAVTDDERIFADFPRFDDDESNPSVARITSDGHLAPYPGGEWNHWKKGDDPRTKFVSVNSIYIDRKANHLWVVDAATPKLGPAVENGPKVVEIDLATDQVLHVYPIPRESAPANSHLNDIRIRGNNAFITESGTGAILVLNRDSGQIRRLLAGSRVTKADPNVVAVIDGQRMVGRDNHPPRIHADQIELSADGFNLFFMAPFGPNLYRVPVIDVLDESLTEQDLERRVVIDRTVKPVGGLAMNLNDTLYLSEVETHSIRAISRDRKHLWTIIDPRLDWPDAYSVLSDGTLYVVAAQIDRLPAFRGGRDERDPPYYMFKIEP